jgi:putative membrane protein
VSHVLALGPAALLAAAYLTGVVRLRSRSPHHWPTGRVVAFLSGCAFLAVGLAAPGVVAGAVVGDVVAAVAPVPGPATVHAVQHLLVGMAAPVGLALGAPVRLLLGAAPGSRPVVRTAFRSPVVHALAHPVVAVLPATVGTVVLYTTGLYALTQRSAALHALLHLHLLVAGYLYAWAIAGPDPSPRRPGVVLRLAVLVVSAGVHAALATVLYSRAGDLPPGAGYTVRDVEVAAQWMYYGGDLVEVALAVAVMAGWYRRRARADRRAGRRPGQVYAASSATAAAAAASRSFGRSRK